MRSLFVDSKELKVLIEKYPDYPIVVVPVKNLDAERGYPDCKFFIGEVFSYPIDNKYNIVFINLFYGSEHQKKHASSVCFISH